MGVIGVARKLKLHRNERLSDKKSLSLNFLTKTLMLHYFSNKET